MPAPNPDALHFLMTRRSRPAKTLRAPGPDRAALAQLLTMAARTPDHGKLEPWRFVVPGPAACTRLAAEAAARGARAGFDADRTEKGVAQFRDAVCLVAVIAAPKPSDKIPQIEQTLSAGAVCLSLLNAALAAGWGANWLTGWPAHDRAFAEAAFGLADTEFVAGLVHIGSETAAPPDRPRPDVAALTNWIDA